MEVFIGNLSAKTKLIDIHNILGEYEMHADFTSHEGKRCDHTVYHFVIVSIKDKDKANQFISRLNGFQLTGKKLTVREYINRDPIKQQTWKGDDRRINEQLSLNFS